MELNVNFDFDSLVREAFSDAFKDQFQSVLKEAIRREVAQIFYSKAIRRGTREFVVEVLNTLAQEFRIDIQAAVKEIKGNVDVQEKIKDSLSVSLENLSANVFEDVIYSVIEEKIKK